MISKCLFYTFFIFPNFIKNELKSVKMTIITCDFGVGYKAKTVDIRTLRFIHHK